MNIRTLESLAHRYSLHAASRPFHQERRLQVPVEPRQPEQPGLVLRVIAVSAAVTTTALVVGSYLG